MFFTSPVGKDYAMSCEGDERTLREEERERLAEVSLQNEKFAKFFIEFKQNWEKKHDVVLGDLQKEFEARIRKSWEGGHLDGLSGGLDGKN